MAKKPAASPPAPIPKTNPEDRLTWPHNPKECFYERPRFFRVHRLNEFEWQAYVIQNGEERPIGKPDLFELVQRRIAGVMRHEGQSEYLANRQKAAKTNA